MKQSQLRQLIQQESALANDLERVRALINQTRGQLQMLSEIQQTFAPPGKPAPTDVKIESIEKIRKKGKKKK